jgi:hypothetical protein
MGRWEIGRWGDRDGATMHWLNYSNSERRGQATLPYTRMPRLALTSLPPLRVSPPRVPPRCIRPPHLAFTISTPGGGTN